MFQLFVLSAPQKITLSPPLKPQQYLEDSQGSGLPKFSLLVKRNVNSVRELTYIGSYYFLSESDFKHVMLYSIGKWVTTTAAGDSGK